jgi:hypothetical protein
MTYTALYLDGKEPMVLHFEDQAEFKRWANHMTMVKEQAARITAVTPDWEDLDLSDHGAISQWLDSVDDMVRMGTPMLPSILKARKNFAEMIKDGRSFNI